MAVNDNYIEISKYRGSVRVCEHCDRPNVPADLRGFCQFCLSRRFLATCLKCDGKGMITETAPWDGTTKHSSVCEICGGSGSLPANKPEVETKPKSTPATPVQPVVNESKGKTQEQPTAA